MLRTPSSRLTALLAAAWLLVTPSLAHAQKALVYCPVGLDATGCNAIVAALAADATLFPGGVVAGYDGTSGTVDLATADLPAYAALFVPSLADGQGVTPYALLRDATIAGRIRAAFVGRAAVWSGTPDIGSTNRAAKDQLIRNLARWTRADSAGTHGPGLVVLQDNSDDAAGRYGWMGGISTLAVAPDTTLDVYANVQVLTATGRTILTGAGGLQIGYTNMASYGLVAPGGAGDATGGHSGRVVLVTAAGDGAAGAIATVQTDRDDYFPPDTVLITGSGWEPGETVSLLFQEDVTPAVHPDVVMSTVADAEGGIRHQQFAIDSADIGVRFTLTATGQTSGRTAQATFTDNTGLNTVTVIGAQATSPIAPGGSTTYGASAATSVQVRFNGNGSCTVAMSATGLPAGATATFAPLTLTGTSTGNVFTLLSVATSAATPPSTATFTVRATGTGGAGNDCSASMTATTSATLAVRLPSATAASGPASSSFGGSATFTANVTGSGPTATGTVQFKDGAVNIGAPQPVVAGAASLTTSGLTLGAHTISAVYSGDGTYGGSTSATVGHTVNASGTTTVLASSATPSVFGQSISLSATVAAAATGGGIPAGSVQFKIDNANFGAPVTLTSGTATSGSISSLSVGSHPVAAVYTPSNGNYTGSTSTVIAAQNVNPANTTTTVASASNPSAFGQAFTFTAAVTVQAPGSGTPTGTVQFRVDGADQGAPVTLAGGSATSPIVSGLAAGPHTLAAVYGGSAGFGGSTSTDLTHTVGAANQTITFSLAALPAKSFGDPPFSVASFASASSGLPVTFSSTSPTRCTADAAGTVTLLSAQSQCTIRASQAGDANFNAAPSIDQTFNIAKANQTVSFTSTAPAGAIVGGPTYSAAATATSGLTVTFSSLTAGVCTSSGTSGATITFVGGGTCTVAANQGGDGNWNAAPQATQSFAVSAQAPQTIAFTSTAPGDAVFGGTYGVSATASSGLSVVFSSLTAGVCTVSGGTVSFVGVGSCTVAANQAGNASFLPASQVTQSFAVGQAAQTINFAALADKTYGDADVGVSATASSGLPVAFAASGQCTVTAASVHLGGAGSCTITASQAGNANYTAAADVARAFTIAKAAVTPVITAQTRMYDGTTAATILTRDLSGVLGTDDVSLAGGTATFADKHAGTSKTVTGSGFTLTGAAAGNYLLSPATAITTARIEQRPIEITSAADSKTYDGTTSSAATPTVSSGTVAAGDAPSFTQSFDTKHVGTNKTLTPTGAVSDGNGGADYAVTFHSSTTGIILTKALTGTITAGSKVYDGTVGATIVDRLLSGIVGSEDVSYVGGAAQFDDRNAGSGKGVTATGLSLSGADQGNYTVNSTATTSADISPRPIGVTAVTDSRIYNGTTASAGVPSVTSGMLVGGDTPGFAQAFDTKNVGTGKTLTAAGVVSDGNSGNNYAVTFHASTTGEIQARALLVAAAGVDKGYDGNTAAAVTLSDNRIPGDVLVLNYAAAAFGDRNTGSDKPVSVSGITVTGADAGNYTFNPTATASAGIAPRAIDVTAAVDSKTYDGTTTSSAMPSVPAGSLVGGDTPNFSQAFDTRHVGNPKTLSATGAVIDGNGGNNYVVTFHPNTGVILARPITVTASSDTRVYDRTTNSSAAPAITVGTLATGDLAGFSQRFDTRHVGTNKALTPTGAVNDGNGGNDYAVDFVAVHSGEIQPRTVTPVIVALDKPYDGTTTATLGSKTVTGTITPDVVTLIVGAASFDTKHAGTNKTVTATGLALGGADASDYQLGATSATDLADISPIALAVAAHGVNKIYDATTTATVTLSATPLSADVVTLNYSGAAFGDKKVGGGKTVTVSGITTGGPDGGDYTPNATATTTADITQAPLTVTANGINKVYDATTAAMVALVVPAFAGDQVTGSYTGAAFGTKSVGTGKTVTVGGIAIAGDDAPNYHLQNTGATTLADITKRPLTVTASATNKFYDGNTGASVTLSATPLSGDVVTISFASASFDNANVGAGKTVTVLGVAFGGGDGGNYSPTPVPVTTSASILAWSLAGYYQPVDMPAGGMVWNTVKGGSTVPLKFQVFVGSAERTDVGAVKAFTATATSCGTPGTEDTVEITTTGGTELRYTGGQFIQNWQTPKSAGTCYRTTMTAQDGSLLTAYFKLK
jgi:hypothetical protein